MQHCWRACFHFFLYTYSRNGRRRPWAYRNAAEYNKLSAINNWYSTVSLGSYDEHVATKIHECNIILKAWKLTRNFDSTWTMQKLPPTTICYSHIYFYISSSVTEKYFLTIELVQLTNGRNVSKHTCWIKLFNRTEPSDFRQNRRCLSLAALCGKHFLFYSKRFSLLTYCNSCLLCVRERTYFKCKPF